MVECPNCGAQNSDASPFCVRCGSRLSDEPETNPDTGAEDTEGSRLLDEAAELYAAGSLDRAVELCHTALDHDPELVAARSLLGMIEEDRGNHSAALAEYEAVLRLAPERTAERRRARRARQRLQQQTSTDVTEDEAQTSSPNRMPLFAIGAAAVLIFLIVVAILTNTGPDMTNSGKQRVTARPTGDVSKTPAQSDTAQSRQQDTETNPAVHTLKPASSDAGPNAIQPSATDQSDRQSSDTQFGENVRQPAQPSSPSVEEPYNFPPAGVDDLSEQDLQMQTDDDAGTTANSGTDTKESNLSTTTTTSRSENHGQAPDRQQTQNTKRKAKIRISVGPSRSKASRQTSSTNTASEQHSSTNTRQRHERPTGRLRHDKPSETSHQRRQLTTRDTGARNRPDDMNRRQLAATTTGRVQRQTPATPVRDSGREMKTKSPNKNTARAPRATGTPDHPHKSGPRPTGGNNKSTTSSTRSQNIQRSTTDANGSDGASPRKLRLQAERAESNGATQKARRLYQRAIKAYRSEATKNPSRAAVNRSAIKSCQRAIRAIDTL